uniref:SH2 domain-containing protein n=1 Tax=Parascaris univalens TaxID=6257 RepID=A0A915A3R9_PARUN
MCASAEVSGRFPRKDYRSGAKITVRADDGAVMNFLIKRTKSKRLYFVYRYAFRTILDLIAYHSRNHHPLNRNGVYIKNGVEKSE